MKTCQVAKCEERSYAKGYCHSHYMRWHRTGDPLPRPAKPRRNSGPCSVEGCERRAYSRGWCQYHYFRWRDTGHPATPSSRVKNKPCTVDGCDRLQKALGYCGLHWHRFHKYGDPLVTKNKRGLGTYDARGYRLIAANGHPNGDSRGLILEHRKIMSDVLGRPLFPEETVHHKNGRRSDNVPENLELWVKAQPSGQRAEDLVAFAREIIERYGNLYPEESAPEAGTAMQSGNVGDVIQIRL